MLDVVHALAADSAGALAHLNTALEEYVAEREMPAVVEPDRETWGTTPEAIEGQQAMAALFPPAKPREPT